ncbi:MULTISPECIES: hypothetical protein [Vibrio]|uniref:hypothetical protein n=1 Tax=Vibrio TaxID=662 RepID=UPI00142F170D|nr:MULTISPECIES: hypothetical protein [Vibrio]
MVGRARSKETAYYPLFLVKVSHRGANSISVYDRGWCEETIPNRDYRARSDTGCTCLLLALESGNRQSMNDFLED